MSRFPFVVRVAVGAVAVAAEKGQELVTGAVSAPLVVGSKSASAFLRVQQDIAGLAVRGDEAIDALFPTAPEEKPAWATFDDEDDVEVELPVRQTTVTVIDPESVPDVADDTDAPALAEADAAPAAPEREEKPTFDAGPPSGRYALYSSPPAEPSSPEPKAEPQVDAPAVVTRLDYTELTLAQLRGRVGSLGADDLRDLLAYEKANRARPPFLTMIENRLERARR
ncbi:lipid droplet-associated protein [Tsukamurella sp. 8F]|uniref:lipid droplet-associated protein n=1 Tax=unclassified Tsukamurella TaxID=2633480 RepID=UPI0023B8C60C|nr:MULTISPECIES: lipid droplet-associated protein [unclassified Tsukamurella]MDF0530138.1 lipid droplet-associated protein [Tsukamurella sp. 8J]MDF0586456.1 lipid droplet-associated protein [Tsukamurella sp. 8F]